ncbi:replication initiator protein A (plasmid) [Staphylococcus sp. IVB6181]|uniref:replication initiator protein A n=1 Tax=Staphylococcus sp. IVB6181 TaxID=2929481 RepID=UPI0021D043C9|nr:replication initiator protein A [Staphylococcus sp. IVB6181]UXV36322.1 replication initiator protein A [Staphylococcus sp. IVB6181]UXV36338.1 replication initiator protein A [Staphylococcus sp. IVB6181]
MSEHRFNIQQQYREKFYQLPKVFFTNEKYKQLSNDAKIAYALLKDRLELSIRNNWFDENGDIFFIFTNENLKNILNCHKAKLIKIKKELTEADLLEQIRCGQGKPNKLYLKNPAVTKEDIYEMKKKEENIDEPRNDAEVRKSNFKKFENQTSRSSKIKPLEVRKSNPNDTEFNDTEKERDNYNPKYQKGSSSNKTLKYICNQLNIKSTKVFENKLRNLIEQFDFEIIEYAIEYVGLKANNPKQYLITILETWLKNDVRTLQQAKNFKYGNKRTNSKEITPEWLKNPDQKQRKPMTPEEQAEFEREREAFRRQLDELWG